MCTQRVFTRKYFISLSCVKKVPPCRLQTDTTSVMAHNDYSISHGTVCISVGCICGWVTEYKSGCWTSPFGGNICPLMVSRQSEPCELMSCYGGWEYSMEKQDWDGGLSLLEWTDGVCVAWEGLKYVEAPSATSSVLRGWLMAAAWLHNRKWTQLYCDFSIRSWPISIPKKARPVLKDLI